jgi:hypothetical protein
MTAAGVQSSPPGAAAQELIPLTTETAAVSLLGARDSGRRSAPD